MKNITYTNFYQASLDDITEIVHYGNKAYTYIKREKFEIIYVSPHGYLLYGDKADKKLNQKHKQK